MSTMPESANLMPFVCKWSYYHSEPQQFETWEKLINHIDKHDINSCNRTLRDSIYICPWEGCNKHKSSIIKLEEHLHRHIRQRPFKCPICTCLRFCSLDALNHHLIINHNDSIVNFDTDADTSDENEELNLAQIKDKIDIHVKKKGETTTYIKGKDNKNEIIPMDNTAKLSYRDVLVKAQAKNKIDIHLKKEDKATKGNNKNEIIPIDNTAKLSYCDVLVKVKDKINIHVKKEDEPTTYIKGKYNKNEIIPMDNTAKLSENKNMEDKDYMDFIDRNNKHQQTVQELLFKAMEAISLLPRSIVKYDLDNENYDDLPDMPQEDLTEEQQDQLILKSLCEAYKGTKAGEYCSKAFEMLKEGC
ncbi:zinc finger, C2H2-type, Ino80 complex subunit Iec1 [Rhizophagus irregularis DAOM 181602=DAOM 197198]|nr:zinc finger, C2H2-type, Ino80 complex subunit Iec1 [Rhizophagus irregularis DAOM 181602=DAOM 197198]